MDSSTKEIPLSDLRLLEARQVMDEFVVTLDGITIGSSFSDIVEEILHCKGKIITSGMGKASIIMNKFSSTLCSLTFPSCFLNPGTASHGDLGLISPDDILFVASTSGKTREIIELIDLAREVHVKKIIGITSHIDSIIRQKADLVLDMGVIQEAGHLHLAPTSSIMVMLALTDCIALVASKEKGVTAKDFHLRHHSGYLGLKSRNEGSA